MFDWDDTLFPTTHLHPVDETEYGVLLSKYGSQLRAIDERAVTLLESCLKVGRVAIITNARKGWVEFSSKTFLPRLHVVIMKYVHIISARVAYEHVAPFDTFKWKQLAFAHLWDNSDLLDRNAAVITNMLSFGDSTFEMEAAQAFADKSPNPENCFLKLIKLKENPTFDEIKSELDVVKAQFDKIFAAVKNLKIKLERGAKA